MVLQAGSRSFWQNWVVEAAGRFWNCCIAEPVLFSEVWEPEVQECFGLLDWQPPEGTMSCAFAFYPCLEPMSRFQILPSLLHRVQQQSFLQLQFQTPAETSAMPASACDAINTCRYRALRQFRNQIPHCAQEKRPCILKEARNDMPCKSDLPPSPSPSSTGARSSPRPNARTGKTAQEQQTGSALKKSQDVTMRYAIANPNQLEG